MAPMNKTWVRLSSATHTFWYQMTGGIIGNKVFGVPVLLLTTTGRKSGRKRTTPLMHLRDGENYVLIASYGGHDIHPAWYLNLRSNPDAEIQVGREKLRVRAETAKDEDRERLYAVAVEAHKDYAEDQRQTKRTIPVVILKPVS